VPRPRRTGTYERELLADAKERAEHVMLVDLGRNDLGRVCEIGSVQVDDMMEVERYSHVMHIVSSVTGTLREDLGPVDVLRAIFPAGTVSGAPKVRAMEIIDELEPTRRGCYAGAVGYVDFTGNLDTCIAIRTVVLKDGHAYVQAGAGIVADSNPGPRSRRPGTRLCWLRSRQRTPGASPGCRSTDRRAAPARSATPRTLSRVGARRMWVTVMAAVMIGATACQASDGSVAPGTGQAAAAVATPEPTATSASTPRPVHTPSPRPEPVRGPLDVDLAMRTVQTLSVDIGVRRPNTEGDEQTREMLTEAFEAAGWTVELDWFDLPQGGQSANVVATWPGRGPWVEPHVLVGAHIDTVPGSPGANDNASGVGVLVAMAHQLADEMPTFPFGVVLVGFGAEEVGGAAPPISVLTEPDRFLGSPRRPRDVAALGVPALRKDFLVDPTRCGRRGPPALRGAADRRRAGRADARAAARRAPRTPGSTCWSRSTTRRARPRRADRRPASSGSTPATCAPSSSTATRSPGCARAARRRPRGRRVRRPGPDDVRRAAGRGPTRCWSASRSSRRRPRAAAVARWSRRPPPRRPTAPPTDDHDPSPTS
jgi:hypothetical protein